MRLVLRHSQRILPEVEWVVLVAGHVEPVTAIAGQRAKGSGTEYYDYSCRVYTGNTIYHDALTGQLGCWQAPAGQSFHRAL